MEIPFTKMHGLGNDFVVIDTFAQDITLRPELVKTLADRRFGIGCDQVLLLGPPDNDGTDVRFRIFNPDGGEVSQCGNGARCIAAYLHDRGLVTKEVIIAETNEGLLKLYRQKDGQVRVNMGVPKFEPADIPMRARKREKEYQVSINGVDITFNAVSMGNPHAVLVVDNVDQTRVETLGPEMQQSGVFPEGVNVGFMQIVDRQHIRLRVYERGTGETLACGSGACAAVVAGYSDKRLAEQVNVSLKGGHLLVSWQGEGEPVWITGPATFVYEGRIRV
ncbi:MAG: diaminopimelate epimerase [Gammaproteobacteria bacterium]|nr:diaminopimelate epimerase [Gammaproteobacteria bacterium]